MAPELQASSVTVVDDEPMVQDILARAARSWNYRCQTASTAEQALALLERDLTPVVVTDLLMPGRGGVWLVEEVRRRWPDVGVIVLTAGHSGELAEQCLRAGADHYFFKPIQLDEFRHVLETTSRAVRARSEGRRSRGRLERAVRRQTRRVRHTFLAAVDSLVRTLEERDPGTAGHSRRVHQYACLLADELGLAPRPRRVLSLAARLHDIGKVGVPEAILNKPGPLTKVEEQVVREHPAIGERILLPVVRNVEVLAAVRGHHERLDGTGYPDGLQGSAIPLAARLLAVVDCFDALTSNRAYRDALPISDALRVLRESAGPHFDPVAVDAFRRVTSRSTSLTAGNS